MLLNSKDMPNSFYKEIEIHKFLPDNLQTLNIVLPGDIITSEKV